MDRPGVDRCEQMQTVIGVVTSVGGSEPSTPGSPTYSHWQNQRKFHRKTTDSSMVYWLMTENRTNERPSELGQIPLLGQRTRQMAYVWRLPEKQNPAGIAPSLRSPPGSTAPKHPSPRAPAIPRTFLLSWGSCPQPTSQSPGFGHRQPLEQLRA